MANIKILEDKLVEGKAYKSFAAMCQELVLINGKPCVAGTPLGSYEKAITLEIKRYAKIAIEQAAKGKRKSVTISKVISIPKASVSNRAEQSNVAEYIRPILHDMINHEYQDNSFVKYHKNLTLDLGYIGNKYGEIYKSYYKAINNNIPFSIYDIQDKAGYARNAMRKLIERLKGYINYYCANERLGYEGVITYKTLMNIGELDFMDYPDQQLYNRTKEKIKEKMENEYKKVNHMVIPKMASEKFNEYKQCLNPEYKPVELAEMWTFEIESGFQPIPQTINLKKLNYEILKGYLNSTNYKAMVNYSRTQEYQDIKAASHDDFFGCNPSLCSDKDVRQALTISKRDSKKNREKEIEEESIMLDFPVTHIDSYINDIKIIIKACKI